MYMQGRNEMPFTDDSVFAMRKTNIDNTTAHVF